MTLFFSNIIKSRFCTKVRHLWNIFSTHVLFFFYKLLFMWGIYHCQIIAIFFFFFKSTKGIWKVLLKSFNFCLMILHYYLTNIALTHGMVVNILKLGIKWLLKITSLPPLTNSNFKWLKGKLDASRLIMGKHERKNEWYKQPWTGLKKNNNNNLQLH